MSVVSSGSFGKSPEHDPLIGTMDFYEGGEVSIYTSNPADVDPDVLETFKLTVDFILHALNRAEWMTDFFVNHYQARIDHEEEKPDSSHLTLIKGGKSD